MTSPAHQKKYLLIFFKNVLFSISELVYFCSSYHDGEHYNSVRSKDDTCSGPARTIVIKVSLVVFEDLLTYV